MRLRHLQSSSVVVEDGDTAVLCDPWLLDGAFYGAWPHYPPLDFEPGDYDHVDYIYVSHVHPDYFHRPTMERLSTDIPVLIHDYAPAFLKRNIERLGFEVIELPHAERTHLAGDLHVNVLGADNCDPEVRGNYFGSGWWQDSTDERSADGSTRMDSMAVFDDGENVLVNANDCRWPLSERACAVAADQYDSIDLLLLQYSTANFYPQCMAEHNQQCMEEHSPQRMEEHNPQCMEEYSHEEKVAAREAVIGEMYSDAEGFVNALEPDYFMPIAGSYVLSGSLADYNRYVASPTRCEAFWHFLGSDGIEPEHSDPILLNSEAYFDLDEEVPSEEYTPIDPRKRRQYVEEVLAERSLPVEADDPPSLSTLTDLLDRAYEQMARTTHHRRPEGDRA